MNIDEAIENMNNGIKEVVEAPKNETETEHVPIENAIKSVTTVLSNADSDRIAAGTNLVNTFNYAVQVQAGRVQWQASDYKAFLIALCALDSVGKTPTRTEDNYK